MLLQQLELQRSQTPPLWRHSVRFSRKARVFPSANKVVDVAVIGGAGNGAYTALDLASRGIDTVVLDKSTPLYASKNNTHLGHPGTKYLNQLFSGGYGLFKEAALDVSRFLSNAPYLVRPVGMIIPVVRGLDTNYPTWMIHIGIRGIADWLTRPIRQAHDDFPRSRRMSRREVLQEVPGIGFADQLKCAYKYYDTQIWSPERLVVDLRKKAVEKGATFVPHTEVAKDKGSIRWVDNPGDANDYFEIRYRDRLSPEDKEHVLKARTIVNTTGPWMDQVVDAIEDPNLKPEGQLIRASKGVHILVRNTVALQDAIYSEANDAKKRPFFIIPYPVSTKEYLMIGTTDDEVDTSDPNWAENNPVTYDEVKYLVENANRRLPALALNEEQLVHDVVDAFWGFRPLPNNAGSKSIGKVSRGTFIRESAGGRILHASGKLTTIRSLAEKVADKVAQRLGVTALCETQSMPLPGAELPDGEVLRGTRAFDAYKRQEVAKAGDVWEGRGDVIATLIDYYGTRYKDVLNLAETVDIPGDMRNSVGLSAQVTVGKPGVIFAQALYAIRHEGAKTLMDIMTNHLALDTTATHGLDGMEKILLILRHEEELTDEEVQQERQAYMKFIESKRQWHRRQA